MTHYTNFELFYEANEPHDAGQLACLYRSVTQLSDEGFFSTEEIRNKPMATHRVTASSGDILTLTKKSYPAFVQFIGSKNPDPDLDIETAADFEYAINNPHS